MDQPPRTWIPSATAMTILGGLLVQVLIWVWWMSTFAASANARLEGIERSISALSNINARLSALEVQVAVSQSLAAQQHEELEEHLKKPPKYSVKPPK